MLEHVKSGVADKMDGCLHFADTLMEYMEVNILWRYVVLVKYSFRRIWRRICAIAMSLPRLWIRAKFWMPTTAWPAFLCLPQWRKCVNKWEYQLKLAPFRSPEDYVSVWHSAWMKNKAWDYIRKSWWHTNLVSYGNFRKLLEVFVQFHAPLISSPAQQVCKLHINNVT